MKKSRFGASQIVKAQKDHEGGMMVADICHGIGISDATFYHWKSKYGGMEKRRVSNPTNQ